MDLALPDRLRWLWSRWSHKLAWWEADASAPMEFAIRAIRAQAPVRVAIRANGYDWETLEEVFGERVYGLDMPGVRRIMDLGGNIGLTAVFLSRSFPGAEVCTVEPMPDNLRVLRRNCALNPGIRVVEAAVGPAEGRVTFQASADPRQHAAGGSAGRGGIEVRVRSIPSLMQELGWPEIDLLKVDIEGGEAALLGGRPEWLRKVRTIVGEGHDCVGYSIGECRRDLEPMGFAVRQVRQSAGAMMFIAERLSNAGSPGSRDGDAERAEVVS
ncbi:MAG: FkbM family methyltransferase [Bryobacterales bacterium]|nr:FkbM family methyltransferase [Bryobacterales bacterium]